MKLMKSRVVSGFWNSTSIHSPPRLQLSHITADKKEIKNFPKLPSATSFIRKTLYEIPNLAKNVNL